MFYLDKIRSYCTQTLDVFTVDLAVPHQAITPREILQNWVRNDKDTVIHEPTNDWNKGDVHPNSIREFEDRFDALEHLAQLKQSPVSIDNLGNPTVDENSLDGSSGQESSDDN